MGIDNTGEKAVSSDRYRNPGHDRRVENIEHHGSFALGMKQTVNYMMGELTGTYTDAFRVLPTNCFTKRDNFLIAQNPRSPSLVPLPLCRGYDVQTEYKSRLGVGVRQKPDQKEV